MIFLKLDLFPDIIMRKSCDIQDTKTSIQIKDLDFLIFALTGSEFTIFDLAKTAGCGLFVKSLHKHNLLHFLRQPKNLNDGPSLFCPTDDAFRKFLRQPRAGNDGNNYLKMVS